MNKQLTKYVSDYARGYIHGWSKRYYENTDRYVLLAILGVTQVTDMILDSLLKQDLMKRYSFSYSEHEVRYIVESIVLNYVDEELSVLREYC